MDGGLAEDKSNGIKKIVYKKNVWGKRGERREKRETKTGKKDFH